MMRSLICCIALLAIACTVRGQDPAGVDVTAQGQLETIRRGDHNEELGSVQSGPEAVVTSALAPPAVDNDRWYINVIVTKDPAYKADCDKLISAFGSSIDLRAWADIDNPKLSWAHFDIKEVDSPTIKDWIAKIRPAIEGKAFPIIHLQPPGNGTFGKNSNTVAMIYGYNGDAKYISNRIRAKIKEYADKVATDRLVKAATAYSDRFGHAQFQPAGERLPAPTVDQQQSRNPVEWPDLKPPPPKTMTYTQIRSKCPKAPVGWVREQVKAGITTEDELAEAYDELLEVPSGPVVDVPEAKPDTENPTHWTGSSLDGLIVVVIGVIALILARNYLPGRTSINTSSNGSSNGSNT